MVEPVETITTENIVATSNIGREIDINALAEDLSHAEFNPSYFSGLVYRVQDIKPVCLIFRSGKVVCTGASTEKEVNQIFDLVFDDIRNLGIRFEQSPEISVSNIVSSADLGREFNLNTLAIAMGLENVEYEPEQFPGLVYRMDNPSVVLLLFGSGKIVITGAKQRSDIILGVEKITQKINNIEIGDI